MSLPRHPCYACGRSVALTRGGRLYRHDPPHRGSELKSCPGSLKVVRPPAAQPVLFTVQPPALAGLEADPVPEDVAAALF